MSQRLLELDISLTNRLRIAERPGPLRTLASILAHSGDSWFWLLGLILIWIFGPDSWQAMPQTLIVAVLLAALFVMAIKFSVRRSRPEGSWGSIYRNTDPHSFPSGHAVRAALLAVMAVAFLPTWLVVILMIWAPLVSLARVAMGVHYLSDVLVGMALGAALGLGFLYINKVCPQCYSLFLSSFFSSTKAATGVGSTSYAIAR
jgi:undecaprenyl-diphosphatase